MPLSDAPARQPMPEPIFTETVTDIDGNEPGEVEVEASAAVFRSRRAGAYALDTSVEAEWIAMPVLGLRLEPTLGWSRPAGSVQNAAEVGASAGAAVKLLQDFEHEFFVHGELLARWPPTRLDTTQPGESALPLATDLRAGLRRGLLTLRWGVGVGALGEAVHAPLRASLAAMAPFETSGRFGFWGIELDADGARAAPLVVALNIVPNLEPARIPFRFALALPWTLGERDERPSLGIFVRVFYESAREIGFGEHSR